MINAETFLANRLGAAPAALTTSPLIRPDLLKLPTSILRVCELGWRVTPILAHSTSASVKSSMAAVPTSDPSALALSAIEGCNWAVATGRGLLILEVDVQEGMRSLRQLCADEWDWHDTLQFRCAALRFFAFRHPEPRVRYLGARFPGLKLHWEGSAVLIPPSWFVYGPPVTFINPDAEVLLSPRWLTAMADGGKATEPMGGVHARPL
jgi:hypothetical protein